MDVAVDDAGEKGDGGWGAEGEWRLRRREGVLVFVCRNSSHLDIQPSHDSILPRGQFIVEFTEFPVLAFIVIQALRITTIQPSQYPPPTPVTIRRKHWAHILLY